MAIESFFHQNGTYDAVDLRRLITDQWITEGVLGYDDFKGTVVNATDFSIASGRAIVTHDTSGVGRFLTYNSATVTLTLTQPTSAKRRFLIYLLVHDEYTEGGDADSTTIESAYTDGASPAVPATPSNAIPLYDITVTYQSSGNGLTHGTTVVSDVRARALHVSQGVPVMTMAGRSTSMNVPAGSTGTGFNGWTSVLLDNADTIDHAYVNPQGGATGQHNAGNSPIYARYSGWYEVGYTTWWHGATDLLTRAAAIVKNDATSYYMDQRMQTGNNYVTNQSGTMPIYLTAGDYVVLAVYSGAATTLDKAALWIRLLGVGASSTMS